MAQSENWFISSPEDKIVSFFIFFATISIKKQHNTLYTFKNIHILKKLYFFRRE